VVWDVVHTCKAMSDNPVYEIVGGWTNTAALTQNKRSSRRQIQCNRSHSPG
jgi:hypothetical protein